MISEQFEIIRQDLTERRVRDSDAVIALMTKVGFDQRLISDLLVDQDKIENLTAVLNEFLNQSLIWIDDTSKTGSIKYLKELILTVENYNELLPLYNDLRESLQNNEGVKRPSLPKGLIQKLSESFDLSYKWIDCTNFLTFLGKIQLKK